MVMPRSRLVAGAAWSGALAMLVGVVVAAQVAWPQLLDASEERCPMQLQHADDVPAWLRAMSIEPGSRLVDVQDDIAVLEAQATVDDVVYVPTASPHGVEAWVYDFGYRYPDPGEEVFTYAPVLCLGGQVPDVVGLDAEQARTLVAGNGLEATVEGDLTGVVDTVAPAVGTVLELGSAVTLSMAPVPPAPATEPSDPASAAGGDASSGTADAGAAESRSGDGETGTPADPGTAGDPGTAVDPGTSTGTRADAGRLLGDWGWLAVLAAAGSGLAWATARALRRGRERRWLRQHLRTRPEAGAAAVSVHEDPRQPRHTVRLAPGSGPVDLDVDERGGR